MKLNFIRFLNDLIKRPSLYFFIFLVIFTFDRHHRFESSKDNVGTFYSDVYEYYKYLPDFFLSKSNLNEKDISTNRRTIGMALLYLPAFTIGDQLAKITHDKRDGYSIPYQWSIRWGSIIYCLIGLFFIRKSLLKFFDEYITLISLICVLFGTNLFYYTYSWGELPHTYLFFLNSLFIHTCLKWLFDKKANFGLLSGLILGFIVLIRPTGIMVLLFPLLIDISSFSGFKLRVFQIFENKLKITFTLFLFFVPIIVQMLIWKKFNGEFVHYSYGKERFFFYDPQIINFLFSWRKGWLIYTPMMSFSILGIFLGYWTQRNFFLFNFIYFTLNIYILSSWWEWSYGGSFGCRALVESYAFFIFPFATFINALSIIKLSFWKYLFHALILIFFYLLIRLNIIQTWQYKYGFIHWSGMNKETYRLVFLRTDLSREEMIYINSKLSLPDANKMLNGDRDK